MRSNNSLDIVDKYRHSINSGAGMILMLNLTHLGNCEDDKFELCI